MNIKTLISLTITTTLLISFQTSSLAGIYKWVDENGQVHYGEKPVGTEAEKVTIRQNTTTKPRTIKKDEDADDKSVDGESTEQAEKPVEVEIPFDLWDSNGDVQFSKIESDTTRPINRAQIKEAATMLTKAEHPVIWAGGGVITGNATEELRQLAEQLNSPVVMTAEGKGAISDNHPLASGSANYNSNSILSMADMIICMGSRFFPRQRIQSRAAVGLKIIQIDIDDEEVGRNWHWSICMVY